MPTHLDLAYVTLFAVVLPLWDYMRSWPDIRRDLQVDPVRARRKLWVGAMVYPWLVVATGAALWHYHDRSWSSFGLSLPEGWRLWVAVAIVLLILVYLGASAASVARNPQVRANVRDQAQSIAEVMPHTRAEVYLFGGVSLTAGFCEEFLFRGYLIWALSPWLGWWGAAALSMMLFAIGHAYQGWGGVLRTGIMGVIFTLAVAVFGSLWPAILIHILWDFSMGALVWLALRDSERPAV